MVYTWLDTIGVLILNIIKKPGFIEELVMVLLLIVQNHSKSFNLIDTWQRVTDLVAFGYLYKDHIDDKWYAITQMMIWETVDKNNSFYFTDTLNGNKVDIYNEEKAEIERLISDDL